MAGAKKADPPLKPVDYMVLLVLHEGDRHGYGIVKDIVRLSEGRIRLVPGNLYSVIARLTDAGLVHDAPRRSGAGHPRRRHYRLTPAGRRRLVDETRRLEGLLARPEIVRVLEEAGRS
jgi:DNA-binding PadR family transcriptional regulator